MKRSFTPGKTKILYFEAFHMAFNEARCVLLLPILHKTNIYFYLYIPLFFIAKVHFQIWLWILVTCISHHLFLWYCSDNFSGVKICSVNHINLLFAGYFGRTRATAHLKRDLLLVYSQVCVLQEKRSHMEGMCIIVFWLHKVSIPVTTRVRWDKRLYFQCCIGKMCVALT